MMFKALKVFGVVLFSVVFVACGGASSGGGAGSEGNEEQDNDVLLCDEGFVLDSESQACVLDITCDNGFTLDETLNECVSNCTASQEWNDSFETCVDLYHVCVAGTEYPDGFVPDESSTQDDCELIPFAGNPEPDYFPAENEVAIYLNKQHVDANYSGYRIFTWGSCWSSTTSFPGSPVTPAGIDAMYGAYFILSIDESCTSLPSNFLFSTSGDQSDDLRVDIQSNGIYARMAWLVTGANGELRAQSGAQFSTGSPICVTSNELSEQCIVPEI